MKPNEIIAALPQWRDSRPDTILASPAWAVPCRLGDAQVVMRMSEMRPAPDEFISLAVRFEDERHILGIAPSARFPELSAIWGNRAEVPAPVLLALVERECGPLLQLLENAVRRQLRLDGVSEDPTPSDALCAQVEDIVFALSRTTTISVALGQLRYLDQTNPELRSTMLSAETEYCAFALSEEDLASLETGDSLLLPELASAKPITIVEGAVVLDENGVNPVADDALVHVRAATRSQVELGAILDASLTPPPPASPLEIVASGRAVALGRLEQLAGTPAFVVESRLA